MEYAHVPVLLRESVDGLAVLPNGIYVDCTFGGGGHAQEILAQLEDGYLIGIDQDSDAIANAASLIDASDGRLRLVHDNFSNVLQILRNLNVECVDGFLVDLGVSSHQLNDASRGFSYMNDAALDMRMDVRSGDTAYKIVNQYSEKRLSEVIYTYGEERYAARIASAIVRKRQDKPIETTIELSDIVRASIPKRSRNEDQHPARRTFQAIRIEVNDELKILDRSIRDMVSMLRVGGRICVISFHSLEDRIVKNVMRELENPCNCPREIPVCVCGKEGQLSVVTRKPITPSEREVSLNPRSRSAKLRIGSRVGR